MNVPSPETPPRARLSGLRVVAVFEAIKGLLVLLVGVGVLSLIHRDVEEVAEHMVRIGPLNPASHYPRIFIDAASRVSDGRLWAMAAAAFLYAIGRGIEAYGLWHDRRWAEWFALVAGGLYLPVELFELFHRPTWIHATLFGGNAVIVAYMAFTLVSCARQRSSAAAESGPGTPPP